MYCTLVIIAYCFLDACMVLGVYLSQSQVLIVLLNLFSLNYWVMFLHIGSLHNLVQIKLISSDFSLQCSTDDSLLVPQSSGGNYRLGFLILDSQFCVVVFSQCSASLLITVEL